MRIPQLALTLTAAAAFAVLGASPASASDSPSAPTALPVTGVVDTVCGLLPGIIELGPCAESPNGDEWQQG